jgi:maleylacetoacetate isomerase
METSSCVAKLYTFWRSSAAYRVRIALNLKGLDYQAVPIHFRTDGGQHKTPEFLAKNPQGLLPLWQEQDWYLAQSLAILEYLEETHSEPSLLPNDPKGRAEVRSLAQIIACEIHPLNNLRVGLSKTTDGSGRRRGQSMVSTLGRIGVRSAGSQIPVHGG